ncbi:MAG: response regulator, partial [Chloroflexota bacterium]
MSKKNILCIEDNQTNMLLISRVVEAEGHHLIHAPDGETAAEKLDGDLPDLILLDVNLPGMNGLDLARQIRQDKQKENVPIIAVTANVLVGDRERCLEAGCNDYLPKPLDIRQLR